MRTKIDVYEIAFRLSELYGCRFVAFEDGGLHDADGEVLVHCSDSRPVFDEEDGFWYAIEERLLFVDFELVDISKKYTTNGVIDFSKCMFDFLESDKIGCNRIKINDEN